MTIQPLSNPKEQRDARELAESIKQSDVITYSLAWLLLRALAQIEALTALVDPTSLRFSTGSNHRYPALVAAGLGHLWVGPSFNDFAPGLVEACRKHLKTHSLPAQRGHALDYIRNRIKEADFGALEQRWEERHRPEGTRTAVGVEGQGGAAPIVQVLDESTVPPYGTPAWYEWMDQRRGGGV
ncbi:MAG: hypothetical protein AAGD09_11425 [Cyanobacteria bacterium P01_F01_bin.56]